jgi:hypothetical protein
MSLRILDPCNACSFWFVMGTSPKHVWQDRKCVWAVPRCVWASQPKAWTDKSAVREKKYCLG